MTMMKLLVVFPRAHLVPMRMAIMGVRVGHARLKVLRQARVTRKKGSLGRRRAAKGNLCSLSGAVRCRRYAILGQWKRVQEWIWST